MAESLSEIGVPVFMADVKGDLTGVAEKVRRRKTARKA
ncbi:helicase HerA-like domain-containing protein [Escherichia coli]